MFSYACVCANVCRLPRHFGVLVGVCASVHGCCTYAHVRICTYECLGRYFIGSHIVACVCKFWLFLISLLVISDVLVYTVKIINGRSADIWHVCMKTAIHRADRKLSTPLCDDSSHHLTILKIKLWIWIAFEYKVNIVNWLWFIVVCVFLSNILYLSMCVICKQCVTK